MVLTQCALLVTGGSQLHEVAAVVTKDRGPSVWVGTAPSCSADSAYQAVCSQNIPRNYDVTASSRAVTYMKRQLMGYLCKSRLQTLWTSAAILR